MPMSCEKSQAKHLANTCAPKWDTLFPFLPCPKSLRFQGVREGCSWLVILWLQLMNC